jgi:hypothetical protein
MLSRSTSSRNCASTTETASSWEKKATLQALPSADLPMKLQTQVSGKFQIWRCEKARLLFVREVGLTQTKFLHVQQDVKLHSCHYSQSTNMFPENRPLQIQFFWWLHQPHCDELTILCRDEACYLRHCVFNIHNTFTWQRISSAIVRLQRIAFRLISSGQSRGALCPTRYSVRILTLWDCFIVAVWRSGFRHEAGFVVSAWRDCSTLTAHYGKMSDSGWTRHI